MNNRLGKAARKVQVGTSQRLRVAPAIKFIPGILEMLN